MLDDNVEKRKTQHLNLWYLLLLIPLYLLSGCKMSTVLSHDITGTWRDASGYTVRFAENGEFTESIYGVPLKYKLEDTALVYTWPDGYMRSTRVAFGIDGSIEFNINNSTRRFYSNNDVIQYFQSSPSKIEQGDILRDRYVLKGSSRVKSEIELYDSMRYRMTYRIEEDTEEVGQIIGLYADSGQGNYLYLYYEDGEKCDRFKESESGTYLATYPMQGSLFSVEKDFASPTVWRGYRITAQASDIVTGIQYEFNQDGTMLKYLPDGSRVNYSYFLDTEGLITLNCTDGILPKDIMWVDINAGIIYRVVYERSGWANYLADLTRKTVGTEETINGVSVIDAGSIVPSSSDEVYLLCSPVLLEGKLIDLLAEQDIEKAIDECMILEQQTISIQELASRNAYLTEERQRKRAEFPEKMGELAKQRQEEEERKKQIVVPVTPSPGTGTSYYSGYYSEFNGEQGTYTPAIGSNVQGGITEVEEGTSSVTPPIGPITANFGDSDPVTEDEEPSVPNLSAVEQGALQGSVVQPIAPEPSDAEGYVQYICNCRSCHRDDFPVPHGTTMIAFGDASIWSAGSTYAIEESNPLIIRVVDGSGQTNGSQLNVYIADHALISSLQSGTKTIRRVSG